MGERRSGCRSARRRSRCRRPPASPCATPDPLLLAALLDLVGLLVPAHPVADADCDDIDYYLVLANWKLGIVLEKTYAAAVKAGKNGFAGRGGDGADDPAVGLVMPTRPRSIDGHRKRLWSSRT